MKDRPIPEFLAHLPLYRGYPVPYFVPKDENGVYHLKYASQEKMENCIKYHKCCICFKPLTKGKYFFISGPMGLQSQTDSHPPMHRRCAEYSMEICPHLYFEKTHRTTDEERAQSYQIMEKPKELHLVYAKEFHRVKMNGFVILYGNIQSTEKYIYENGILKSEIKCAELE